MTNNFSLLLALRYLKPKRTFVSIITLISILGVSLGVTILMVVISVMRGFEAEIKETMLGFEAHIELRTYLPPKWEPGEDSWDEPGAVNIVGEAIQGATGDPPAIPGEQSEEQLPEVAPSGDREAAPMLAEDMPDWREVAAALLEQPDVVSATPFASGLVFLEFAGEPTASAMLAVDPGTGGRLDRLDELMQDGVVDLDGDNVIMGLAQARQLGVWVGDTITIYAPSNIRELVQAVRRVEEAEGEERESALDGIRELVLPLDVTVVGIFDSIRYGEVILLPLFVAQELLALEDNVHGIEVMTTDAYRADGIRRQLHEAGVVPPLWSSQAWMEKHANFFAAIRMERSMMYFVLFMVVVVAAFCVMNTMITVTVQKRREVGIITALGARLRQIIWIFLAQGMVVGVIGMVGGVCLGMVVIRFRNDLRELIRQVSGFELFDSSIYGLVQIPAKVEIGDLMFIGGGAFLLCSVAALIPAYMAARVDPARALRNE